MSWRTAWTIARRELGWRFRGLRLLLVCLFLGTGALAAIGTLTTAIEQELEQNGRQILGGDLEVEVWQRGLTQEESAALARYGRLSGGTRLQAVAQHGENTAPVELKSVDGAYPLYGTLELEDGRTARAPPPGSAWLAQGAMDRLGLQVGQSFTVGTRSLRAAGVIAREPDRLGEGFQLGPTVIVDEGEPQRAGLLAPGSMYRTKVRVAFDRERDPGAVRDTLDKQFPLAGFEFRTRDRASPGADRFIGQMGQFLTLVGLAALVIAGIGIGGGVSSYLEARRASIATLKILGADSRDIARIYALQIGAAALAGSAAGLLAGVAIVPLLAQALQGLLPVESGFVFAPGALLLAAAYGLLVAFVFAATPLLRARRYPAMALMRARVAPLARDRAAWLWVGGGLVAIVALALLTARSTWLTAGFLGGAAAMIALLAGLGWVAQWLATRAPRTGNPLLRTAIANLHRPGSGTPALVTALGFGLTAFVLLAAVQTAIDGNVAKRVPERAPDYFVLDVPPPQEAQFRQTVQRYDPQAAIRTLPALRGAITAFGPKDAMTQVAELKEIPEGGWPLRGERGLTYSDAVPPGNVVTDGQWWPKDYGGEPLVSVDEDFAQAIGLNPGDYLSISLLGVERTARVANLRRIDWESLGFNYVLVFSPNALEDAPHNLAATIDLTPGRPTGPLLRDLVRSFPATSVIEVGPILTQARDLLRQIGLATLAAASVAVLAGLAVLLGAIAAARAARTYDTVILRVLGASRRQVLLTQLAEYALLALVLAVLALVLGSGLAWLIVTQLFEFDWLPDWPTVFAVLGAGLAVVLGFAVAGSLLLLRARPAQVLRTL
ncbi:FtsX-like permease family protein [Erythrobacter sp. LQ02-29]|uniref:ABC transporter permease n=1 Tax=Erythrobacter sp. LQ02-29 TaxID=2920384 RepID=UPI001F4F08ED|nr:FtsX-like permease family protein [Erythrobacter sp. LQ02-29]MCP9222672.1 FtsX-like permease family protein [Erythrobacter sp. LQ02-29]